MPGTSAQRYTTQGYAIQNAPGWISVSRGASLGLVVVAAFNLMEVFAHNTSAVQNWLCNFRMITQPLSIAILAMLATALLMYSIKPALPGSVWIATVGLVALVVVFSGWDLWEVTQQTPENLRQTAMSRPLGVLMLLAVAGMGILVGDSPTAYGRSSILTIVLSCILSVLGFVVVTLQSGSIGDPVPDDAVPVILVLGCAIDSDGKPSEALTDRVTTGSQLHLDGHGTRLLLAGGGDDDTAAVFAGMKKLALEKGVPETAIMPVESGIDAAQVFRFMAELPELKDDRRIVAVSHWYQLARIRMLGRLSGIEVVAIPAVQQHALFDQNRLYLQEATEFLKTCLVPPRKLLHR